jgi:nitroreductase/FMN reductase [NAD(P)H]
MTTLREDLAYRFGDVPDADLLDADTARALARMAARASCRRFKPDAVPSVLIDTLCAVALASPSKSDLQQRDIVIIEDIAIRARINALLADQEWIASAPHLLIFLGNNRRHRQVHDWRGFAFANDHLDAFFNAAVDAGIALSAFVTAAESVDLGCCPISVIRNHSEEVSRLLGLPDHVFPVAALGLGWPLQRTYMSLRLPLSATVHRDRYRDCTLEVVDTYDRRRNAVFPYRSQRNVAQFGTSPTYGWSEDKARQYAVPERADFGAFIRRKGFDLR